MSDIIIYVRLDKLLQATVSLLIFYNRSYVYWTVNHLDSWIKRDQLNVTCFIISLFTAQRVSDVDTSILSLHTDTTPPQPNHNVTPTHIEPEHTTHDITHQISRKLLRIDVSTSETCWSVNNEIIKQVTSSWSLFIQLYNRYYTITDVPVSPLKLVRTHREKVPSD